MRPDHQSQDEDQIIIAEQVSGKKLSDKEVSQFWFNQGLNFIKQNPEQFFKLLKNKFIYFFQDNESTKNTGGIDFNSDKINLNVQNQDGEISAKGGPASGWKFKIDPAMLRQLQQAVGFRPEIIDVRPLKNLRLFENFSWQDWFMCYIYYVFIKHDSSPMNP